MRRALPSTSLIIATYNWPRALDVVLESVRAQRELPDEVLVADDGSGEATREIVAAHQLRFPVPLTHVWHEDRGFRLAAIRNAAIRQAAGDYIVQVDGDIVLGPQFVRAHRRFARPGSYVQGSRCLISPTLTESLLRDRRCRISPFARGLRNRQNGMYLPWLVPFIRGPRDADRRTRGCHMAFWRDDLQAVNGYDEGFVGWGREDSELAARLIHSGVQRRNFKYGAAAFHLWHPEAAARANADNEARYEATIREQRRRCTNGLVRSSDCRHDGGTAVNGSPPRTA
jgi:glycosyltransferase involved in cell wall biosynthesis